MTSNNPKVTAAAGLHGGVVWSSSFMAADVGTGLAGTGPKAGGGLRWCVADS